MPITDDQAAWFRTTFDRLVANVSGAILGKDTVVRLALTCLLSEGHLLLEDVPGTGKTSLAKALANTVKASYARIQFTPDLMPSDVQGVTIFNQQRQEFEFRAGPILHSIVLADEINRASPKTQSALLEVMEEGHVTVDGIQHLVEKPFMVIATQNPIEQQGTYRLPEAQLDRFLMKLSIGHPDREWTVRLLAESAQRNRTDRVEPIISGAVVADMAGFADQVTVRDEVLRYVSHLAEASRAHRHVRLGLSTRGCLAYVRCAKAWALAHGRTFVRPDDIKELAHPLLDHRILLHPEAQFDGASVEQVIRDIFQVPVPHVRAA